MQWGLNHRELDSVKAIGGDSIKSTLLTKTHPRELDSVKAIGVDEIAYGRGDHYLTLAYQIEPAVRACWGRQGANQQELRAILRHDRPGTGG